MTYKDENGYQRGKPEHSDLISRQIAFEKIYSINRNKFPLLFSQYVIHHIDRDKDNNSVKNLDIVTKEDHNQIHKLGLRSKKELDLWKYNEVKDKSWRITQENLNIPSRNIRKNNEPTFWKPLNSDKTYLSSEHLAEIKKNNPDNHINKSKIIKSQLSEIKRNIIQFSKYLYLAIKIFILSLIGFFLFPIAYYIIIYVLWFLILIIGYLVYFLISLLFSYDSSLMRYKYENSLFTSILELIRHTPQIVWNFVYNSNIRPIFVLIIIIISFVVSYIIFNKISKNQLKAGIKNGLNKTYNKINSLKRKKKINIDQLEKELEEQEMEFEKLKNRK